MFGMWSCAPNEDMLVTVVCSGGLVSGLDSVWECEGIGAISSRVNLENGLGELSEREKEKLCLSATRAEQSLKSTLASLP